MTKSSTASPELQNLVLNHIREAAIKKEPAMPIEEMAAQFETSRRNIQDALRKLEKNKFIVRELEANRNIYITADGHRTTLPDGTNGQFIRKNKNIRECYIPTCKTKFISEGPGNRMCDECRKTVTSDYAEPMFSGMFRNGQAFS